jgi:hypothetical protein
MHLSSGCFLSLRPLIFSGSLAQAYSPGVLIDALAPSKSPRVREDENCTPRIARCSRSGCRVGAEKQIQMWQPYFFEDHYSVSLLSFCFIPSVS